MIFRSATTAIETVKYAQFFSLDLASLQCSEQGQLFYHFSTCSDLTKSKRF